MSQHQIVMFYQQDFHPKSIEELDAFILKYGLTRIKFAYSAFGGCYFVEVSGDFEEDNVLFKSKTPPEKFDWNV